MVLEPGPALGKASRVWPLLGLARWDDATEPDAREPGVGRGSADPARRGASAPSKRPLSTQGSVRPMKGGSDRTETLLGPQRVGRMLYTFVAQPRTWPRLLGRTTWARGSREAPLAREPFDTTRVVGGHGGSSGP